MDNSFEITMHDSIPFTNAKTQISGDVDGDGRIEFFVGATTTTGNWTIVYESDGNNSYSIRFIIHLLSGGLLTNPMYLTEDMNSDGKDELIVASGTDLFVFQGVTDNAYELWYYRREELLIDVIQALDVNNDNLSDIITGQLETNMPGEVRLFSDVHIASPLVGITSEDWSPEQIRLEQNFPNPFNAQTTIPYFLGEDGNIQLSVFNALGERLCVLVEGNETAGEHRVFFDASGLASGMYIYQLKSRDRIMSGRMILVK
jgi:hypothetical protein